MTAAATPVLSARGLAKRFGHRAVLAGADLEAAPGDVAVLTGANGAGKTTLLRIVAAVAAPDEGTVRIAGCDAREDGRNARAAVGYAGHDPGLYPALTLRANLAFVARFRAGADVAGALAAFDLTGVATERAGVLSRGTRQRAALARAFMGAPSLVVLDEPWTGLDDANAARLHDAIGAASKRGASVVLSAHAPPRDVAGRPARRLTLAKGRLTEAAL